MCLQSALGKRENEFGNFKLLDQPRKYSSKGAFVVDIFLCRTLLRLLCSCTDEDFENFWLLDQENTIEMVPLLKTPLLFLWSASGPSNVKHFYGFYVPAKMKKEKKVFSPWQTPSLFLRGILLCLLCSPKDEQREKIVFFRRLHCFSSLHLTPSTTARALPANIKPE